MKNTLKLYLTILYYLNIGNGNTKIINQVERYNIKDNKIKTGNSYFLYFSGTKDSI